MIPAPEPTNSIYHEPTPVVKALVNASREIVQGVLAERGEQLAPDSDFTTVTALANHYGLPRREFLSLLDTVGIRRRKDGSPSDMSLRADAARLTPVTNAISLEGGSPEAYWRWHRKKLRALLVSTGAMSVINANRRKSALVGLDNGILTLTHHVRKLLETGSEPEATAAVRQVIDGAKALRELAAVASPVENVLSENASALKRACGRLHRILGRRKEAGLDTGWLSMGHHGVLSGVKNVIATLTVQT